MFEKFDNVFIFATLKDDNNLPTRWLLCYSINKTDNTVSNMELNLVSFHDELIASVFVVKNQIAIIGNQDSDFKQRALAVLRDAIDSDKPITGDIKQEEKDLLTRHLHNAYRSQAGKPLTLLNRFRALFAFYGCYFA
ncbi:hypothetical protein ACTOI6_19050 (plasmid) [Komagataeibacter intermedius]|uniref:hypothetical protein n=1 Tax=Komagataeibacter intermedius TaxID=66229 RepID=UPI004035D1C6